MLLTYARVDVGRGRAVLAPRHVADERAVRARIDGGGRRRFGVDGARRQLEAAPTIEPSAVEEAEALLEEAKEVRTAAGAGWRRLVDLEAHAKQWLGLASRRGDADYELVDLRAFDPARRIA